jgi:hypothetical protein
MLMDRELQDSPNKRNKPDRLKSRRSLRLRARLSKFAKKDVIIALTIFLIAALFTIRYYSASRTTSEFGQVKTNIGNSLQKGTPDFQTVSPNGQGADSLGGWTKVSPPNSEPTFAYTDKIGTIAIIVSQQLLPSNLQSDSDQQVKQLAQGFNATKTIDANGTTVHIGKSSDGPQSVIFYKGKLLILIKSGSEIADSAWSKYISTLQ